MLDPHLFVLELSAEGNKAGICRRRKDVVKAVECCPRKQKSIPASATEFLCDGGQIT